MKYNVLAITKELENTISEKFDLDKIIIPNIVNLNHCLDCWIEIDKSSHWKEFTLYIEIKSFFGYKSKKISQLSIVGKPSSSEEEQFAYLVATCLKIRNFIQNRELIKKYDLQPF